MGRESGCRVGSLLVPTHTYNTYSNHKLVHTSGGSRGWWWVRFTLRGQRAREDVEAIFALLRATGRKVPALYRLVPALSRPARLQFAAGGALGPSLLYLKPSGGFPVRLGSIGSPRIGVRPRRSASSAVMSPPGTSCVALCLPCSDVFYFRSSPLPIFTLLEICRHGISLARETPMHKPQRNAKYL